MAMVWAIRDMLLATMSGTICGVAVGIVFVCFRIAGETLVPVAVLELVVYQFWCIVGIFAVCGVVVGLGKISYDFMARSR